MSNIFTILNMMESVVRTPAGMLRLMVCLLLISAGGRVVAQSYFTVKNGIPCLPVSTSVTPTLATPKPGMMVYNPFLQRIQVYDGSKWINICWAGTPPSTTGSNAYFTITQGYPTLGIPTTASTATSVGVGTMYWPKTSAPMFNYGGGNTWYSFTTLANTPPTITGGIPYTRTGQQTGISGGFQVPVLAADPSVTTSGAFYFSTKASYLDKFRVYDGTIATPAWLTCDCSTTCGPVVTVAPINGDSTITTSARFYYNGYSYFQKTGLAESVTIYPYFHWFLTTGRYGTGSLIADLGTTQTNVPANVPYATYADAWNGYYLNLGVIAWSSTPLASDENVTSVYVYNCAPQVSNLHFDGALNLTGNKLYAAYCFYDKENNPEDVANNTYTWYVSPDSLNVSGTVAVSSGTGESYKYYNVTDANIGNFLTLKMQAKASLGYSTSDIMTYSGKIRNNPPQVLNLKWNPATSDSIFVGDSTLHALYTYYDKESDLENAAGVTYKWYRGTFLNDTTASATLVSTIKDYTLSQADLNTYITLRATTQALTGKVQSNPAYYSKLFTNCQPQVSGMNIYGDFATLNNTTIAPGYTYYDKEGNPENAASNVYWWYLSSTQGDTSDGALVQTGTGNSYSTYTVQNGDIGKYLTLKMKASAAHGMLYSDVVTSSSVLLSNTAPVLTVSITGDYATLVNSLMTATPVYTDAEGNAENTAARTYAWYVSSTSGDVSGTPVSSGTGTTYSTYNVQPADVGTTASPRYLTVVMTTQALTGKLASNTAKSASVPLSNCQPQISGMDIYGDFATLTNTTIAPGYSFYDKDGNTRNAAGNVYWWYLSSTQGDTSDGALIKTGTGSTYSTYSVNEGDIGKYLTLKMKACAAQGVAYTDVATSSSVQLTNTAPMAKNLKWNTATSDSTFVNDSTLHALYTYYDKEGNLENTAGVTYKWYRGAFLNDTTASATLVSTTKDYTLSQADLNTYITLRATTQALTGRIQSSPSYYSKLFTNCAPQVSPTINGDYATLTNPVMTAGYSYWDKEGNPRKNGVATYVWYLSATKDDVTGTPVSTTNSYTVQNGDIGKYLVLKVTSQAQHGTLMSDPGITSVLLTNAAPVLTVSITGDYATLNNPLMTSAPVYTDAEGNAENTAARTYAWYVSSTSGDVSGTPVSNGSTYTVQDADIGTAASPKYLTVVMTTQALTGKLASNTAKSASVTLSNCEPQAAGVAVTGTLTSGNTVKAAYAYYDKEGNARGTTTYQWYRATTATGTGATPVAGATAAAYTLTGSDSGYFVGVAVTPVAVAGTKTGSPVTAYGATAIP